MTRILKRQEGAVTGVVIGVILLILAIAAALGGAAADMSDDPPPENAPRGTCYTKCIFWHETYCENSVQVGNGVCGPLWWSCSDGRGAHPCRN